MKIGFPSALTLLFIGLKLTHYIDWSWWYVTMPVWLPAAIILGFWLLCQFGVLVCEVLQRIGETKEETKTRHDRERLADALEKFGKGVGRK